jgi:hypothetical protein
MVDDFLSSRASSVVKAGRRGLRATEADRQRIEEALRARIGPQALPPASAPSATAGARGLGSSAVTGAAIGVCLVGGLLLYLGRSEPPPPPSPPVEARPASTGATAPLIQPAPSSLVPPLSPSELAMEAGPSSSLPASRSSSGRPRQDGLAQEVALLSRATSALRAGRAEEALKALNEHQREFPNGVLGEERRAAKAQALCSLGRVAEGRAELARLSPQSLAARRAAKVCDSLPPSGTR